MSAPRVADGLEGQIGQWRSYLQGRDAIRTADIEELEDHLRDQVATLEASGLAQDEAFLVAVKRMGALDAVSREYARVHSDRLWKQLVVSPDGVETVSAESRREVVVVFALAVAAAASFKIPALFGIDLEAPENEAFYFRNAPFFVLPFLAGYFVWKRGSDRRTVIGLAAAFLVAAVFANIYPFNLEADTLILQSIHLPIALWLAVGIAYAGGRWGESEGRMDFVRYSGEFFIYYVLIALGGGVLTGFTAGMFQSIGIDPEYFIGNWLVPCGALGAVIVASWLVEAKQSVIENMAPVLTRLFAPLFAITLIVFLATMAITGQGIQVEREILIAFDLLLVLVIALLLYSISARDTDAPAGWFDWVLLVLVVSALLVDGLALAAIAARISDFGFTPNRVAALGENILLLINLAGSAWLYGRFLTRRGAFRPVERWQTGYLPVYAAWAAVVVVLFPVLFGFD